MTGDRLHLLDVNVLMALTMAEHPHFARAHAWWPAAGRWATTSFTESAYLRLMLNPVAAQASFSPRQMLSGLRALTAQPGHEFIADDARLVDPAIDLGVLVGHQQITDFHLVDLAARHSALFVTLDAKLPRALAPADRRYVLVI